MKDQIKIKGSSNGQSFLNWQKLALNSAQLSQVKGGNGTGQNQTDDKDHIGIIDLIDG